jgi:hypothetical protein
MASILTQVEFAALTGVTHPGCLRADRECYMRMSAHRRKTSIHAGDSAFLGNGVRALTDQIQHR